MQPEDWEDEPSTPSPPLRLRPHPEHQTYGSSDEEDEEGEGVPGELHVREWLECGGGVWGWGWRVKGGGGNVSLVPWLSPAHNVDV